MREIIKTISIPADGKPLDFRLTKLFSAAGPRIHIPGPRLPDRRVSEYRRVPVPAGSRRPLAAA